MTETPDIPTENTAEAAEAPQDGDQSPQVFDAEYVGKLRQEAAEARVKARAERERIAAQAMRAYAQADGRLVDLDVLPFDAGMLTEDGLVDVGKVTAAIDILIEDKPYLRAVAAPPVTQGYRDTDAPITLRDIIHGGL